MQDFRSVELEQSATATGYQSTSYEWAGMTHWGFDLGLSGASLTPVATYGCDAYGNATVDTEMCESDHQRMRDVCCSHGGHWEPEVSEMTDFYQFFEHCMSCGADGEPPCEDGAEHCDPILLCATNQPTEAVRECARPGYEYVRNTYLREHVEPVCEVEKVTNEPYPLPEDLVGDIAEDQHDELFKDKFIWVDATENRPAYYRFNFSINMDAIEAGALGQFGVLAPYNFNYRLRTFAANIVGTDVLDCDKAESPATCAANPWVSYDLKQLGDVYIRNHHLDRNVKPFSIPTGRISGGKAWAAEQVIGFPVSGAHQSTLHQLNKVSLMGRPLQGEYELRIYAVSELEWEKVEDIQLIMGYHYWTRSE